MTDGMVIFTVVVGLTLVGAGLWRGEPIVWICGLFATLIPLYNWRIYNG